MSIDKKAEIEFEILAIENYIESIQEELIEMDPEAGGERLYKRITSLKPRKKLSALEDLTDYETMMKTLGKQPYLIQIKNNLVTIETPDYSIERSIYLSQQITTEDDLVKTLDKAKVPDNYRHGFKWSFGEIVSNQKYRTTINYPIEVSDEIEEFNKKLKKDLKSRQLLGGSITLIGGIPLLIGLLSYFEVPNLAGAIAGLFWGLNGQRIGSTVATYVTLRKAAKELLKIPYEVKN